MSEPAIVVWREKLAHLEREMAIASDPAVRFQLTKLIEEAKAKIEELSQFVGREAGESAGTSPRGGNAMGLDRGMSVDVVIVTALEEERDAVLALLPGYQKTSPSDQDVRTYFTATIPATFSDGTTTTYSVAMVTLLNMGRVEAANATGDAIRRWKPRYVLLVGIAGGIAEQGVGLGDVLVSDQVVDYELQKILPDGPKVRYSVHRADARLLAAAQNFLDQDWRNDVRTARPVVGAIRRVVGPIATGDKVIAFADVLNRYRDDWPKLIGVEMEAGGAASACFQSAEQPGFFMVRSVSDLADEKKNAADTVSWRQYACEAAAAYAIGLLKSAPIPVRPR